MGNPWIFNDIEHYLETGEVAPLPDWEIRKAVLLKHLAYMDKFKESRPTNKMGLMRRVAIMYISSMRNAARLRASITPAKTYEELLEVIGNLVQ
jgi:tRNA-dihydrouridine synthase